MASTRKIIKTETIGNQNAPDFNDGDSIPNINIAAISRIVVMHDRHIQSLTVGFNEGCVRNSLIAWIKGALH